MFIVHNDLARAFNEWLRRFEANPEEFAEVYSTDGSYGDNCAAYLISLLDEPRP